jgi:choline dehydrogenase-like flavoprotein
MRRVLLPRASEGSAEPTKVVWRAELLAPPQLLQLSGIGRGEELKRLGIPVVNDLPGVGKIYRTISTTFNRGACRTTPKQVAFRSEAR